MRVGSDVVLVVAGREPAVDQGDRHHILNAVVPVGRIGERSLLVDDPDRRLVRPNRDPMDVVDPILDARMELHGALDGGLRMELGREADLEQDVLHDIAAAGTLELERLPLNSTS